MSTDVKLSTTRINVFLQCKLKYKFNYIDHLPKVANPSFKLGTAVHETLEYAGHIWKEKGHFSEKDVENILKKYNESSIKEGIDDLSIHRTGLELIKAKLPKFVDDLKIIGLEKKFGLGDEDPVYTKDGVPLIGAIDKLIELDPVTLCVADYKTQNTAPTPEYIRTDIQLSLYDLVSRKLYPQYENVILCLDLLKFEPVFTYRTKEERDDFEDYLKVMYDSMVAFDPDKDSKATLNIFCSWCDYKDYCGAYKEACSKSDYTFLELNNLSDQALIDEWKNIKNIKNLIEGRKQDIDLTLLNRIRESGVNIANADLSEEIYIRQNARVDYDVKTVFDTVPIEDFVGLVSINKKAVKTYIDSNKVLGKDLAKGSIINYTSPFLDNRKLKKSKKG